MRFMPNCFQLLRGEEAIPLVQVDEEMCLHFKEPCDPKRWFMFWYDIIGFDLAAGKTFGEIRGYVRETYPEHPILVDIADWLQANFSVRHWVEIGRPR